MIQGFVLCILSSKFCAIGFAVGFRRRSHFNSPTQLSQGTHVAYSTYENYQLANALNLEDAINDLPLVENDDSDDERSYGTTPRTYFKKYIRLKRSKRLILATATMATAAAQVYYTLSKKLNDIWEYYLM